MKYQVIVVDDLSNNAQQYARIFNRILATEPLYISGLPDAVEFEVVPVFPKDGEEAGSFRKRLEAFLLCQEEFDITPSGGRGKSPPLGQDAMSIDSLHLQAAIIDYHLAPPRNAQTAPFTGMEIADFLRKYRPNVQRFLLSNEENSAWAEDYNAPIEAFFNKKSILTTVEAKKFRQHIKTRLDLRSEAPFWDGLKKYTEMPKVVMHAMAISEAGSLATKGSSADFFEYFGTDMFFAEASLTLEPLDSLLSPKNRLKRSLELYARIMGGEAASASSDIAATFVTNGTSTANKMVAEIVTSKNGCILIDRNCHISHHYAYLNQGVNPVFIQPDYDAGSDTSTVISATGLADSLRDFFTQQKGRKKLLVPDLIVITNCGFDGYMTKPVALIRATIEVFAEFELTDRLDECAFLFDEAWFGFARFHPSTIEYSAAFAMAAFANDTEFGDKIRIYSTTSIHKTLSGLRQTSAILAKDPIALRPNDEGALIKFRQKQTVYNHTTTSPNAALLSSIDVARRQIDLEGTALLDASIASAESFRSTLKNAENDPADPLARFFRLVDTSKMTGDPNAEIGVDPTKVLVSVCDDLDGPTMKTSLWTTGNIQVNKFSERTLMFMFMIGFDTNRLNDLLSRMRKVSRTLMKQGIVGGDFSSAASIGGIPKFREYISSKSGRVSEAPGGYFRRQGYRGSDFISGDFSRSVTYLSLDKIAENLEISVVASAGFITPYPPGFPILIPGQRITDEVINYLDELNNPEVHGTVLGPNGEVQIPVVRFKKPKDDE